MTYVIAEPCIGVKDRACVDECPVDCIYEGEDQLFIHPEECVDCDACLPACPVDAIFPADNVPAEWTGFTASPFLGGDRRRLRRLGRRSSDRDHR
ncbi:MAG: ferredoxin family protein [Actinobacteria bacterium]|nr:ferredoxin family protein [Actinomycetota bacterium]